jgi:hypothetical protein
VQVANEVPGFVEQGTSLLYSFMQIDAKLISPASSVPSAVFATLHSQTDPAARAGRTIFPRLFLLENTNIEDPIQ